MSHQQSMTMCLRTKDAEEVRRGCFEFQVRGAALRERAFRVGIGSIELPMVQRSVEDAWSRLYVHESAPRSTPLRMQLVERTDMGELRAEVHVPPEVVKIVKVERRGKSARVIRCAHAHGFFGTEAIAVVHGAAADPWLGGVLARLDAGGDLSDAEKREMLRRGHGKVVGSANASTFTTFWWSLPTLVGSFGDIPLSADVAARVEGDPTAVLLTFEGVAGLDLSSAWLRVPTPPSPAAMAELVSAQLRISALECRWSCVYADNTFRVETDCFPQLGDMLEVQLRGSLCAHLALPEHSASFARGAVAPHFIAGGAFFGWSHAALSAGWYAPCHRSMGCGGAPRDICEALTRELNGVLLMPDRGEQVSPGYVWAWTGASGEMQRATVPNGKYTADTFADTVEELMNAGDADESFSVRIRGGHMHVDCERRDPVTRRVVPCNFKLHFGVSGGLPASLIGFDASTTYQGSSGYASHAPMPGLRDSRGAHVRTLNTYQVSFPADAARFCISHAPMHTFAAVVDRAEGDVVVLRTFLLQQPFALFVPADTRAELSPLRDPMRLLQRDENGGSEMRDVDPASFYSRVGRVVETSAGGGVTAVHTPGAGSTFSKGSVLTLSFGPAPYSLCFDERLPSSMHADMLGFERGCTAWGEHGRSIVRAAVGSTRTTPARLPPFVAPRVHDLDHPDYVLVYLEQPSGGNTSLVHVNGNAVTKPLAKIVLYPLFRHERNLPNECVLSSGESITRFRLQFRNPDGSAYHFHGKSFSISLNLTFIDP